MKKAWEGTFTTETDSLMEKFNRSLDFDIRLCEADIQGSRAYALALKKAGILSSKETVKIRKALADILKDIFSGKVKFLSSDEDIHMAVERLLSERAGEAGRKIHSGRSRNDQVATDTRLYVKKAVDNICRYIRELQKTLLNRAKKQKDTILPGYTHMQQAQPVSLAHYLLSFFFALQRDMERFRNVYKSVDVMPLGSGALAGTGFSIDRKLLAKELGFSRISENSMDSVSDRDFILEFISAASVLMMHLSRYAEDFIIWSTTEFGFIEISEAYSTGSSMMPQKKNPDSMELIRGKTGRIYGSLIGLLTVMKGIPLTYAKDMQEDKEPLFDTYDTLENVLQVMGGVIRTVKFRAERMKGSMSEELLATDMADFLTKKGMAFREAHKVIGKISRYCVENNKKYSGLTLQELKRFSSLLDKDVLKLLSFKQSLANRNVAGGTGPDAVARQIDAAKKLLLKKM